jgi:hypothetical protein
VEEGKIASNMQVDVVVHAMDCTLEEHKLLDEEATGIEVETYNNSSNVVIEEEINRDKKYKDTTSLATEKENGLEVAYYEKDLSEEEFI